MRYHNYLITEIKRLQTSQHIYQQEGPFLLEIFTSTKYQKGYFRGSRNTIELLTYKEKIFIPQKIQKYVVKLYHKYLLYPGLYQTEAIIHHHLY